MKNNRSIFDITTDIATISSDIFLNEEEIEKRLGELYQELQHKEDGIWALVQKFQQDVELADKYLAKIQKQKKIRQNAIKSIKNMVIDVNQSIGQLPKHSDFNPITIGKTASVNVIDESKIPDEYWVEVVTKKLDKKKMLSAMKSGTKIPGADINNNQHVRGLK
jgi:hypothetical protein